MGISDLESGDVSKLGIAHYKTLFCGLRLGQQN
jgi:hypothetical protein